MKNRKIIAVIGIVLILSVVIVAKVFKSSTKELAKPAQSIPEVHYHAGFVVFDNGSKIDFSGVEYMNIEPCTLHKEDEKETPEHNQLEKAHLHDSVGDVVHTHREGAKWGDLFTNINYPLDYSKVTAFINGEEVKNIKNLPIKAYDSLVIFIGKDNNGNVDKNLLTQAVTVDHIKNTESKSENCGN